MRKLMAMTAVGLLLAACGDGINEGSGGASGFGHGSGAPPELTAKVIRVPTTFDADGDDVDYSGGHQIAALDDGTFVMSGYDNASDRRQPERGALWVSRNLEFWERTGFDVSDGNNQQTIIDVAGVSDRILAVGTDYSPSGSSGFDHGDAVVWLSDDGGNDFRSVTIAEEARTIGLLVLDDKVMVWGALQERRGETPALWTSTDEGDTWSGGAIDGGEHNIVGVQSIVVDGDDLLMLGATSATDPDEYAGYEFLPDIYTGEIPGDDPVDIGVWTSSDGGETWDARSPDGLAGLAMAQLPFDLVVTDDRVVIGGAAAQTEGRDDMWSADTWVCDADLQDCEQYPLGVASETMLGVLLHPVDDYLVVVVNTFEKGANFVSTDLFTFSTGGEITSGAVKGVTQIEDMLVVDGVLYLIGIAPLDNTMDIASVELP